MENRFEKLIVGYDFSPNGHHAFETAVAWARAMKAREVKLVTALPHHIDPKVVATFEAGGASEQSGLSRTVRQLEAAEARAREETADIDTAGLEVTHDIEYRSYPGILTSVADLYDPDLIVVGATGRRQAAARVIGTDTERLVRRSMWPVLVAHPKTRQVPRRILVAIDFSEASRRALGWALQLAAATGARVEALHVVHLVPEDTALFPSPGEARAYRDEVSERVGQRLEVFVEAALEAQGADADALHVSQRVLTGAPHEEIINEAGRGVIDLLAIGTLGRSGVMEVLIGGTSERVLRALPTSILMVKPDAFSLHFKQRLGD